jgi:hypothetical protein
MAGFGEGLPGLFLRGGFGVFAGVSAEKRVVDGGFLMVNVW